MRVMVDTNIIISAMVFKSSKLNAVLRHITEQHELFIAEYAVWEVKRILGEKFSDAQEDIDRFFEDYPYTLVDSDDKGDVPLAKIRDKKDYPVLYAAIVGQIDVLVTGDSDLFEVKVDRPDILSPQDYLCRYEKNNY